MKFIYPQFLWALSLIIVPVLIHLFNFRRYKLVYFSNVSFLQSIKKDSKSKSTLRNILVLVSRILAIVFLVLAFARPYIPDNYKVETGRNKVVSLYIDNSFSMENTGVKGPLIELAKIKAIESIHSFSPGTKFNLITNDFNSEYKNVVEKDQIIDWLQSVKISKSVRNISEIINYHNNVIVSNDSLNEHILFMISDFQKSTSDIDKLNINEEVSYFAIFLKQNISSNVIVDSLWFESPGQYIGKEEKLLIRITNDSPDELIDLPVQLFINDTLKGALNVNIQPNNDSVVSIPFIHRRYGNFYGKVSISDFPVTFDNTLYFNYSISPRLKVLVISDNSGSYPFKLFQSDSYFDADITSSLTIPYNTFNSYKMIVVDGLYSITNGLATNLEKYILNGGSVLIAPSDKINIQEYCQLCNRIGIPCLGDFVQNKGQVSYINYQHRIFENAFSKHPDKANLPYFSGYFNIFSNSRTVSDVLLKSESGISVLNHYNAGKGEVYLSALPFSEECTNIIIHPVFVPFLYNSALQSGGIFSLYRVIEPLIVLEIDKNDNGGNVIIREQGGDKTIYPELFTSGTKIGIHSEYINAGHYNIVSNERVSEIVSVNDNRKESKIAQYSESELKEKLTKLNINTITSEEIIETKAKEWESGIYIHRLMLWLVLLFILAEVLLLRFYKRQS